MLLENIISIDAPRGVVWSVTIDIENWVQWMPTVTTVKRLDAGAFDCGSAALIKQPGLPLTKWVVKTLIPSERFTWETRAMGMHMIATHELSSKELGTQSILRVEISGIVARLLYPQIYFTARRTLQQENSALKATCEAMAAK